MQALVVLPPLLGFMWGGFEAGATGAIGAAIFGFAIGVQLNIIFRVQFASDDLSAEPLRGAAIVMVAWYLLIAIWAGWARMIWVGPLAFGAGIALSRQAYRLLRATVYSPSNLDAKVLRAAFPRIPLEDSQLVGYFSKTYSPSVTAEFIRLRRTGECAERYPGKHPNDVLEALIEPEREAERHKPDPPEVRAQRREWAAASAKRREEDDRADKLALWKCRLCGKEIGKDTAHWRGKMEQGHRERSCDACSTQLRKSFGMSGEPKLDREWDAEESRKG